MSVSLRLTCLAAVIALLGFCLPACGETGRRYDGIMGDGHTPRLFGATYMTMNNPYFEVLNNSLGDVIESNGDILIARDPARDQQKQNAQILEMIEEGIVVLFLNPVDWKGVKPALEACREAGVAVFNVDTLVYDTDYVISVIESDNYGAGVLCAEDMMKKKDSARIVVLNSPTAKSITQRVQGFLETIDSYPQYQVVHTESCDGELEIALEVMGGILATGLEFDVVLGGNDPTALGALAALWQSHREQYRDVLIYGIDGSPDFMTMLNAGYVEGTSVQSPKKMGTVAAETAYRYLNGEEVPSYIGIPVTILTEENLNSIEIFDWQ